MEENKNAKASDELVEDSLDAVAGGKWSAKDKKALRAYCQNFGDSKKADEKYKQIIQKYNSYEEFAKALRGSNMGFYG